MTKIQSTMIKEFQLKGDWEKEYKTAEARFTHHYNCDDIERLCKSLTTIFPSQDAKTIEQAIYQNDKYPHDLRYITKCISEAHILNTSKISTEAKQYLTEIVTSLTQNKTSTTDIAKNVDKLLMSIVNS